MNQSSTYVTDTIVAQATPIGPGAIAILRISGDKSLSIARALLRKSTYSPKPNELLPHRIFDPITTEVLDQVMMVYFEAPRSYTGEPMLEIHCHGSMAVVQMIRGVLLTLDTRPAEPGEFTRRAYINNKINISQAEAIAELIDAQTPIAAQHALAKLENRFANMLTPIKTGILTILQHVEVAIDHPDEEEWVSPVSEWSLEIQRQIKVLEKMLASQKQNSFFREGLQVSLIGKPNVGKSSLFNELIQDERALISDTAGTTRDYLESRFLLESVPIKLMDTAGLRTYSTESLEQLGMERTLQCMARSDVLCWVLDQHEAFDQEDEAILKRLKKDFSDKKILLIKNKSDLKEFLQAPTECAVYPSIQVSAKKKLGITALKNYLLETAELLDTLQDEAWLSLNERQICVLQSTLEFLHLAEKNSSELCTLECIAQDLWDAIHSMDQLTGDTLTEDVLDQIFLQFCIGK